MCLTCIKVRDSKKLWDDLTFPDGVIPTSFSKKITFRYSQRGTQHTFLAVCGYLFFFRVYVGRKSRDIIAPMMVIESEKHTMNYEAM